MMKWIFALLITTLLASCWATPEEESEVTTSPSGDSFDESSVLRHKSYSHGPPASSDCQCVPYHRCRNTRGVGIIDIRFGGACNNYLETCCEEANVIPYDPNAMPKSKVRQGCGKRMEEGIDIRINGNTDNEAQFGEFPWMVAILNKQTSAYLCGGALIHPSVVLTAAHCVKGRPASIFKVRAGEWDTQTEAEIYQHQERRVASFVTHEKFYAGDGRNDLALLKLSRPVDLAEHIDVICLPESHMNFDLQRCIASGWGKSAFGAEHQYQSILKRIELPVVPHGACQSLLRTTRLRGTFVLDKSLICAGGEDGKDTCKGDGGSPLVCPIAGDRDRYYQAGIVSWGIGCGKRNIPGVYASVAYGRSWIDGKMNLWGYGSKEYTYTP